MWSISLVRPYRESAPQCPCSVDDTTSVVGGGSIASLLVSLDYAPTIW